MRITRTSKVLTIAAVLALSLTACSGSGDDSGGDERTVSAETYMNTLCGELQTWLTALQEGGSVISDQLQGAEAEEAREVLGAYLDDAIQATQEAEAAIGEAGVPDVEGGAEAAQAAIAGLDAAEQIFVEARAAVDELPDDRAGFAAGTTEIGQQIQTALADNPLTEIEQNTALAEAEAQAESCVALNAAT
ncbi:MAG: hypothetical protein WEA10_10915 [Actinomycetota bacterium]